MSLSLWLAAAACLCGCEAVAHLADNGWPTAAQLFCSLRARTAGRIFLTFRVAVAWLAHLCPLRRSKRLSAAFDCGERP